MANRGYFENLNLIGGVSKVFSEVSLGRIAAIIGGVATAVAGVSSFGLIPGIAFGSAIGVVTYDIGDRVMNVLYAE